MHLRARLGAVQQTVAHSNGTVLLATMDSDAAQVVPDGGHEGPGLEGREAAVEMKTEVELVVKAVPRLDVCVRAR